MSYPGYQASGWPQETLNPFAVTATTIFTITGLKKTQNAQNFHRFSPRFCKY